MRKTLKLQHHRLGKAKALGRSPWFLSCREVSWLACDQLWQICYRSTKGRRWKTPSPLESSIAHTALPCSVTCAGRRCMEAIQIVYMFYPISESFHVSCNWLCFVCDVLYSDVPLSNWWEVLRLKRESIGLHVVQNRRILQFCRPLLLLQLDRVNYRVLRSMSVSWCYIRQTFAFIIMSHLVF